MRALVATAFAGVIVFYVLQMISSYRALAPAGGTWKEHLWAVARGSATKLWAKLVGISASALGMAVMLADDLNAPQVAAAIQQYLQPDWVPGIMLGIMIVTELARGRSLDKG